MHFKKFPPELTLYYWGYNIPPKPYDKAKLLIAYQILAGVPDERLELRQWSNEPTLTCGTIACAGGWLALHGGLGIKLFSDPDGREWGGKSWPTFDGLTHFDAMGAAFARAGLYHRDLYNPLGKNLFGSRLDSNWDEDLCAWLADEGLSTTDHTLVLARLKVAYRYHSK